jgi:hypothetical protein
MLIFLNGFIFKKILELENMGLELFYFLKVLLDLLF